MLSRLGPRYFLNVSVDHTLISQDALNILSYLRHIKSSRTEEFRIACDKKFGLSTVFKSPDEQATLRQGCLTREAEDADAIETF